MSVFRHSLHPAVISTEDHGRTVAQQMRRIGAGRPRPTRAAAERAAASDVITIELTTVSLQENFDAFVDIQFAGAPAGAHVSMIVDSGNSVLIVPRWEDLANLPAYRSLGDATDPWGSPAKIVQGPLLIPTADGGSYKIDNCVFYACTGGDRTANFGVGCIAPWSASGWNTPAAGGTLQAPLAYSPDFLFAEFAYAPATHMLSRSAEPRAAGGSYLTLYRTRPPGYTMLQILRDTEWMSVIPKRLTVGDTLTAWPGTATPSIAMVDTGGGPVFLSDPQGYVYPRPWPGAATCPTWASTSTQCNCISDALTIGLTDGTAQYEYTVDTKDLPASVQGLTAVMCETNHYMMNQYGMNIGGVSALFNAILIDYNAHQVGFKRTTEAS